MAKNEIGWKSSRPWPKWMGKVEIITITFGRAASGWVSGRASASRFQIRSRLSKRIDYRRGQRPPPCVAGEKHSLDVWQLTAAMQRRPTAICDIIHRDDFDPNTAHSLNRHSLLIRWANKGPLLLNLITNKWAHTRVHASTLIGAEQATRSGHTTRSPFIRPRSLGGLMFVE